MVLNVQLYNSPHIIFRNHQLSHTARNGCIWINILQVITTVVPNKRDFKILLRHKLNNLSHTLLERFNPVVSQKRFLLFEQGIGHPCLFQFQLFIVQINIRQCTTVHLYRSGTSMIRIRLSSSVNIRSFNSECSNTSSNDAGSSLSMAPASSNSCASNAQSYSLPSPNTSNNSSKLCLSTFDKFDVSIRGPCFFFFLCSFSQDVFAHLHRKSHLLQ